MSTKYTKETKADDVAMDLVNGTARVAELCEDMKDLIQEEFRVLILGPHRELLKSVTIAKGTVDSVACNPRDVFREALATPLARGIILVHNHPTGSIVPSQRDQSITKRLGDLGTLLDMPVVDSVIITKNGYVTIKGEMSPFDFNDAHFRRLMRGLSAARGMGRVGF